MSVHKCLLRASVVPRNALTLRAVVFQISESDAPHTCRIKGGDACLHKEIKVLHCRVSASPVRVSLASAAAEHWVVSA